jgi:AraC-like DNA-binding protein
MPAFEKKGDIPTGIIHREKGASFFQLNRYFPAASLADFVEHYWIVEWSLPEGYTHVQEVLPALSVQLVFQLDKATVHGVKKQRFIQHISGTGRVVGVKFKPGGFYPFLKKSVGTIAHQETDGYALLGITAPMIHIPVSGEHAPALEAVEALLLRLLPKKEEKMLLVQQITATALADRTMTATAQLAGAFHLTVRTLERLFSKYVGINPKWVIKIFRFHDVVERIASSTDVSWAQLATDLGYFDQAHFIKDFRMMMGKTPQEYALECRKP